MRLVGVNAQRALAIVGLLCVPITALWWFATGPVFELMDIEAETTELAKRCKSRKCSSSLSLLVSLESSQKPLRCADARAQILCIWPAMANTCASKFLQAQGIVKPYTAVMMIMVLPVRSLDLFPFG